MTKITCLADAINHIPRVRVIKVGDENFGKEFDIASNNFDEARVRIKNIKPGTLTYSYSEIQFLTPVQYEGRYIGFGDKVNDGEVFDYIWASGEWVFRFAIKGDYSNTAFSARGDIITFEPLHKLTPKIELSTEELVEELKRRGVVTQGDVINQ